MNFIQLMEIKLIKLSLNGMKKKANVLLVLRLSGNNVGVDESITISGEALSFLSTGIDTRVYFIKNF